MDRSRLGMSAGSALRPSAVEAVAALATPGRPVSTDDQELMVQMDRLEAQLKASRQKWKVIKGTASAVVAGSGVNWVEDDELRDIVLDPEDEDWEKA